MSRPWFIYTLHDPREPGVVRYVGWTIDPKKRLSQHIRLAKAGKDRTYCGNWKRALLQAGVKPALEVVETGFDAKWGEAEERWIAHYRMKSGERLTNQTSGGEGFRSQHTVETKARISAALKGRPKNRTPEHTENLMVALRARQYSDDVRTKMRTAHLGKKATAEHRSRISDALKKALEAPELRAQRSATATTYASKPETRAVRGARLKARWADPTTREALLEAQKQARLQRTT